MRFLQGKPLHVRTRIATIATGCIAGVLIIIMIYTYARPAAPKHDPEAAITSAYATLLEKIQSLFSSK
ncbi:MAG: hypothetical protein JWL92_636 [Candidatus Nomurabacteria bacterium]|nr:hypothetical protein [Candidatus Nomurabacteria bacterium]